MYVFHFHFWCIYSLDIKLLSVVTFFSALKIPFFWLLLFLLRILLSVLLFLWSGDAAFLLFWLLWKFLCLLTFHSFPITCLNMIFFVIILHGVYHASWIYGLVFSSVLENSLSPVILLKALLNFSATQVHMFAFRIESCLKDKVAPLEAWLTSQFLSSGPLTPPCLSVSEVLQKLWNQFCVVQFF